MKVEPLNFKILKNFVVHVNTLKYVPNLYKISPVKVHRRYQTMQ
jgi:hypothetical protein